MYTLQIWHFWNKLHGFVMVKLCRKQKWQQSWKFEDFLEIMEIYRFFNEILRILRYFIRFVQLNLEKKASSLSVSSYAWIKYSLKFSRSSNFCAPRANGFFVCAKIKGCAKIRGSLVFCSVFCMYIRYIMLKGLTINCLTKSIVKALLNLKNHLNGINEHSNENPSLKPTITARYDRYIFS